MSAGMLDHTTPEGRALIAEFQAMADRNLADIKRQRAWCNRMPEGIQ